MAQYLRCYTSGQVLVGEENPLIDSETNIQAKIPAGAMIGRVWMKKLSTLAAASEANLGVGIDGDNSMGNDGSIFPLSQGVMHTTLNNKISIMYQGPVRSDAWPVQTGLCALTNESVTSGSWEVLIEYFIYDNLP